MPTPTEIQNSIDSLSTLSEPIEFTVLAAETKESGEGISFSVPTGNDLPDLSVCNIPPGQIVFVESLGIPVISSLNEWKGLDGRTFRRDFAVKQIFSWGSNDSGQIGIGTTNPSFTPAQEGCLFTDWCDVSTTTSSVAGIKTDGSLWIWGSNSNLKLGIGNDSSSTEICSPVREFCSATNWCQVSMTGARGLAIKTDGTLWAWGSNLSGRLGIGNRIDTCISTPLQEFCSATNWCSVSAGFCHALAVKTTGEIWGWGSNTAGRIGDGTASVRCSPVREFCSATNWCSASAGGIHSSALKLDGSIWTWGCGINGNLGNGDVTNSCSPVREISSSTNWITGISGFDTTSGIKSDGTLWSWGYNTLGNLGDGTTSNKCSPVREITSSTNWCQVSFGYYPTGALKTDGSLWVWGQNRCGTFAIGSTTPASSCSPVREITSSTNWCKISFGCDTASGIKVTL